ncbi:MAG: ribosome maturation factor RimP [Gammaproteobacteria bacterium]|nr:ribosome maturation factor RimP [Gammaproteobacteria bacterium]
MSEVHREQLVALLEPTVEQLGYELADIELDLSGNSVLRLFIDKADGIALEDCEAVSRQVSALLDVEDPIPGEYNLEVSSPGLNRRLVKPEHFERFAGSRVKVRLRQLVEGRRRFNAELMGMQQSNVVLREGQQSFQVPLSEIEMARLVPQY